MNFHRHFELEGKHAFLSASKYHWVNYDIEKMQTSYRNFLAAERGTKLHELACELIKMGIKLPRSKKTLNSYVNDAIGFKMTPEQPLYYSEFCFGTADAISFKDNFLRIHDLKTGVSPVSIKQLEVYAALFFLEYGIKPENVGIELRIYQNDEVEICQPGIDEIVPIMDKIVTFDKILKKIKEEEDG